MQIISILRYEKNNLFSFLFSLDLAISFCYNHNTKKNYSQKGGVNDAIYISKNNV